MKEPKSYKTMDIYEGAAIEQINGVTPDSIITIKGSKIIGVLVYNDDSKLPDRSKIEPFLEYKEKFIKLKRKVFDLIDGRNDEKQS